MRWRRDGLRAGACVLVLAILAGCSGEEAHSGSTVSTSSIAQSLDVEELAGPADLTVEPLGAGVGTEVLPVSLVAEIEAVDGAEAVVGSVSGFPAIVLNTNGDPVEQIGPPLGVSWDSEELSTLRLVEGRPPTGGTEVGIDVGLAGGLGFGMGDSVSIQTPLGLESYEVVGTVSYGQNNDLAGATLVVFERDEASRLFSPGGVTQILVGIDDDAALERVRAGIEAIVGDAAEVRSRDEVIATLRADLDRIEGD